MEGLNRQEVMQIIDEKLRQLNLGNHYDIFCREHNPLDGTHKDFVQWDAIQNRPDILGSFNAPWVDVREFGATGDRVTYDTTAFQAANDSLSNGGVILVPLGTYKLLGITLSDGVSLIGAGKSPTTGLPTMLDFSAVSGADNSIFMTGASDINIENLYITGRDAGSGHEIAIGGNSRRINLKNLAINTSTTGSGICVGTSLINSEFHNIVTVGGLYGINIGATSTSLGLYNCYCSGASGSGGAGYLIQGTYIGLYGCAADGDFFGYIIQNASQIGLYNCGAETTIRNAVHIVDSTGISLDVFRSHENNAGANAAIPSFLDIQNSDRIKIDNCRDSSPNAATINSIGSTTADAGNNIVIVNPNFDKAIHSNVDKIRLDDGVFMPVLKSGTTQGGAGAAAGELWVDTDDANTIKQGT